MLLNFSILNGPGKGVVHGREVGEKGVTCVTYNNALLREARAGRELAMMFGGQRSAQKQYAISTKKANNEGSSKQ